MRSDAARRVLFVLLGLAFGFALSRSGAGDYDFVQGMFLLTNFQLFGIIGGGVVVTAIGLQVLKRTGRTIHGESITIRAKVLNRGTVVGSLLFGAGWSFTGMCPGPVLVNLGEGKVYALAVLAGVLTGTWLLGAAYDRLQAPMGLPAIEPASVSATAASPASH